MKAADADDQPRGLQARQALGFGAGLVEADDEHVAEARQQGGERQQHAVGPGGQRRMAMWAISCSPRMMIRKGPMLAGIWPSSGRLAST